MSATENNLVQATYHIFLIFNVLYNTLESLSDAYTQIPSFLEG